MAKSEVFLSDVARVLMLLMMLNHSNGILDNCGRYLSSEYSPMVMRSMSFFALVNGLTTFLDVTINNTDNSNSITVTIANDLNNVLLCSSSISLSLLMHIIVKLSSLQASGMRLQWMYTSSLLFSISSQTASTGRFSAVFDMMPSFSSVNRSTSWTLRLR